MQLQLNILYLKSVHFYCFMGSAQTRNPLKRVDLNFKTKLLVVNHIFTLNQQTKIRSNYNKIERINNYIDIILLILYFYISALLIALSTPSTDATLTFESMPIPKMFFPSGFLSSM